jgi:hypothetical protein
MTLNTTSAGILRQLTGLLVQLDDEAFSRPLSILDGNTLGKHVRHIIEFYRCLIDGHPPGVVDYDGRRHDPALETDRRQAVAMLHRIGDELPRHPDKPLKLRVRYNGEAVLNDTSFRRELVYNIEHAVHHMAILRMAVRHHFGQIELPASFGVAQSTIRFQESQCAQ